MDDLSRRMRELLDREAVIEWACAAEVGASRFAFGISGAGAWGRSDPSYRRPLEVGA